jgi:hypothetical protein
MMGSTRESLKHKYSLVDSCCFCGRHNNCCGATCCKPHYFIDVVTPEGKVVSTITKASGQQRMCRQARTS